jgi:hypothetical protein
MKGRNHNQPQGCNVAIIDGMSAVLITWLQVHFIAETSWERKKWKTTLQKYSGFGLAPTNDCFAQLPLN